MLIADFLLALASALVSVIAAVPMALGLWLAGPWPHRAWLRLGLGAVLAAAPAIGFSVSMLARDPVPWCLAQAATGLPVIVLAIMVRLGALAPRNMRIATVSGLSPAAGFRLVVLPLIVPGALGGGLLVLAAVLAERLPPLGADLVLPVAAVTAGLVAIRSLR